MEKAGVDLREVLIKEYVWNLSQLIAQFKSTINTQIKKTCYLRQEAINIHIYIYVYIYIYINI